MKHCCPLTLAVLIGVCTAAICPAADDTATPLERTAADALTSHGDMIAYLERLQTDTRNLTLQTIGRSVQGRPIVLLRFKPPNAETAEARDRLRVFFFAQQHGDEPSGKEAAIALARDVATGRFSAFLAKVDLLLVPQVNPDGSEAGLRRNAAGADLNRHHLTLSQPELVAIHAVFQEHMPQVTLDVHEYGSAGAAWTKAGIEKNFGQQIGALSNLNTSLALRDYAWSRLIPDLAARLEPGNVHFERYLVVNDPAQRFRYSTAALNDGRNSMAIYNTLSFITEGQKGPTTHGGIHQRARRQLETMKAMLDFCAENAEEVKRLVQLQREVLTSNALSPDVAVVMDYAKDPARPGVTVSVKNLQTGRLEQRTFHNFYPQVKPIVSVRRPSAYVIPPDEAAILDVLRRHRIRLDQVAEPFPAAVETYRIQGVKLVQREDKETLDVDVITTAATRTIPAGCLVVSTDQVQTNLIVTLLEPHSQFGLAQLDPFSHLLKVGSTYPILRLIHRIDELDGATSDETAQ